MKACLSIMLALCILGCSFFSTAAYAPTDIDICAESVILADYNNGTILYEKNADTQRHPASLTKIMTAVVVLAECDDPENEIITVSKEAIAPLEDTGSSLFNLYVGERMAVIDLLAIMLVQSANDAAATLGYHFGGNNTAAFVDKMNQKAAELGMTGTHYTTPYGLTDDNHYTTARDMYTLTLHALEYEIFERFVTTVHYTVPATNMREEQISTTSVHLQNPDETRYYYPYAKGIKTGHTAAAGRCLITTAEKDGKRYLCVLMKCPRLDANGNFIREEFALSAELYDWAFEECEYRTLFKSGDIVGTYSVSGDDSLEVVLTSDITASVPSALSDTEPILEIAYNEQPLSSPIAKGQALGTATIMLDGTAIAEVEVAAARDVPAAPEESAKTAIPVGLVIGGIVIAAVVLYILYFLYLNRKRLRRK